MTAGDTTRRAESGVEAVIERVAGMLHSSYCECDGWLPECQGAHDGDRRVAHRLASEGLLAPAPLHVVTATNQFGESHRRWATEWEPVDRAEDDGKGDQ